MNAVDLHPSGATQSRNGAWPRQPSLAQAAGNFLRYPTPRIIALVFIPLQVLIVSLAVAVVGFWLLLPTPQLAFTTMATSFWMLLTYEWTHYLIHSPYRPRTRFYRYVWRAHRLHHFRNERYWFGVTVHVADHLLRTFPEKDSVPVSPTARTLGVIESGTAT